jgi:hypothetical protein
VTCPGCHVECAAGIPDDPRQGARASGEGARPLRGAKKLGPGPDKSK